MIKYIIIFCVIFSPYVSHASLQNASMNSSARHQHVTSVARPYVPTQSSLSVAASASLSSFAQQKRIGVSPGVLQNPSTHATPQAASAQGALAQTALAEDEPAQKNKGRTGEALKLLRQSLDRHRAEIEALKNIQTNHAQVINVLQQKLVDQNNVRTSEINALRALVESQKTKKNCCAQVCPYVLVGMGTLGVVLSYCISIAPSEPVN